MEDTNLALGILCSVGVSFVPTQILARWTVRCWGTIEAGRVCMKVRSHLTET